MKEKVVLTVGITAHAEGILAHKTMMGVFAGLSRIDTERYPYEIIVHIDNGDDETIKYFSRYENDKRFKIIKSSFGDLGMSRNCIATNARGKYISFLDADDILSFNWYVNALKRMEESEKTIMVHPNVQFNFGAGTRLEFTIREDSGDKFKDAVLLAGVNRWCSAIMGKRETFLKYPYMETKNGYGYEDYHLNSNTVGYGIKHMIAPETVMFYRQKREGSLLASSNSDKVIQPYVELLDIDYMKTITGKEVEKMRGPVTRERRLNGVLRVYYSIRKHEGINYFIIPVAKLVKKIFGIGNREEKSDVPDFVIREWKSINEVEDQLYPTPLALREIFQAKADDYSVGLAYYDLVKEIPALPQQIFVVPWIRFGGADKVLINYIKAIEHNHPDWKVAIITTLPGKVNKSIEIPKNAYVIDFGNKTLWPTQKELLFSRLMTQLRCKNIHIINSEYGYLWAASHKKFVKSECKLDVSIFSMTNEYDPGIGSYANPYLVDIYDVINKIYTDNENMVNDLCEREGFDILKLKVIYQPIKIGDCGGERNICKHAGKFKILWASRIDNEKMPDIVPLIMKKLDPGQFEIDMYGEKAPGYVLQTEYIRGLKYKGLYNGIKNIKDISQYDMFLYTSNRDGMPNVLLEVASIGIPIVASNIGGVSEFIKDGVSGLLVDDITNEDIYVEKIKLLAKSNKMKQQLVDGAFMVLKKQHSWDGFYKDVKKMIDS